MTETKGSNTLQVTNLRCEYAVNPLGLDVTQPRLSWIVESAGRGQRQTAYQIQVASTLEGLEGNRADLWDSGVVSSSQTHHHAYAGTPLRSGQRAWWRVQTWDKDDQPGGFSEAAWWEMGLLERQDWHARWIGTQPGEFTEEKALQVHPVTPSERTILLAASPYFRRDFESGRTIARARIYATAKGVYEIYLNGQRVGDAFLAPGWTDYNKRLLYQTYDVTGMVQPGANVLGAILGAGWYAGHIGWEINKGYYGFRLQLLAQLVIEYTDGTSEIVGTDDRWRATTRGAIRYSDMLAGELYDAQRELAGWSSAGYEAKGWVGVESYGPPTENLEADCAPAIRITEELRPQNVTALPDGKLIFDMGQNMVGWVRLEVSATAGTRLQLRFAEVLNDDGSLYTVNLRSARQTDTYIARGEGIETFEPHFTFHGFRFVELSGYTGQPTLDLLTGCVIHSDTPPVGEFKSSNELVNQLVSNIRWGQRGNFVGVPTDCPQRDERLGWMGDAQIFARTATYNMHSAGFYRKWVGDITDGQSVEGGFPNVAPRMIDMTDGAPAWADAGVIVPWTMFLMYGDTRLIEQNYEAMEKWMHYLYEANPGYLRTNRLNNNFGDWLALDNMTNVTIDQFLNPGEWMEACQATPKVLLATAYWAYDALLMEKMGRAIGRDAVADRYKEVFEKVKAAFNKAFVTKDGRITSDTQTSYVLALHMDLLPENLREAAAANLVEQIKKRDNHLATGFVGAGYLCPVLSEAGYSDVAYELLLKTTFPSWGYSIKHGATTIWERWDGWTEEKGFQSPAMNSFNHYSLGSVGQWLYQYVAGIDTDPEQPGFYHLVVRPQVDSRLEWVEASYQALTGTVSTGWQLDGSNFTFKVTVPANVTATVTIPCSDPATVKEGDFPVSEVDGIEFLGMNGDTAVYEIGSGTYVFTSQRA